MANPALLKKWEFCHHNLYQTKCSIARIIPHPQKTRRDADFSPVIKINATYILLSFISMQFTFASYISVYVPANNIIINFPQEYLLPKTSIPISLVDGWSWDLRTACPRHILYFQALIKCLLQVVEADRRFDGSERAHGWFSCIKLLEEFPRKNKIK